ncbi:lantibiotic dehydratase [Kibdelosporangium aridum]|uniref:Thiopeptide-type bacteriocin biosynthesis domain-containing protein n=1 Tax=Kibdelosporangium aridum TaxID=2030 RepID=A0A1W2FY06_KIBAR|nr:lantibiotic dehydratase [Kibdelosporangium aridum]SMD26837.1 thiopeptide-type bacteriocin biosynthesis domain-containing protein [Kibdelosporangium aridum]
MRRALAVGAGDLWRAVERQQPSDRALPSLDLSVFVLALSPEAVDAGDFQMMVGPNFGASAAGRVLGRFGDLLGEQARTALRSVADAEAVVRPGRVWAEVNYLPRKGRLGNVATRALVRDHELVLNTTPGGERIIRAADLLVGVRDNRFVLRWSVTGHEVVPCSGHMLNPRSGSPVIQFLDDVSRDGYAMPSSFDWGPAANFPFLPRVQAGRIILTPARWLLRAEEFTQQWRERWQVPRHVYLSTADNRLLLDLADPDQLKQLPDKGLMVLQEALPAPDQAWLPGSEGRYVSEFVVPLIREEIGPEPEPARQIPSGRRMRPPGSDWLFAKLYHLPTFENDLLTGPVKDFCDGNWFFMRYVDPGPHLRIRWTGDPRWLTGELAPRVLRWSAELVERGYCTRVALDTYDRELERYGGPTALEAAESLFAADSSAVLDLLRLNDIDRTLLGMYTVDDLLVGLGLTEDERLGNYRLAVADRRATADEFRSRQVELRRAPLRRGTA